MGARLLQAMQGRLLSGLGKPQDQTRSISLHEAGLLTLGEFLEVFRFKSPLDPGYGGLGPVHCAAVAGNLPVLRRLVAARADINQRTTMDAPEEVVTKGVTPLMMASACNGSLKVIQGLLELRADLHLRAPLGQGPLKFATYGGRTQLMDFYLDLGLDINEPGPLGDTALITAAGKGRPGPMRLLLERRADVHRRMIFGKDALMTAVLIGSLECCQVLVQHGADAHRECQPTCFAGHCVSRLFGLVGMTLGRSGAGAVSALTKLRGQTPLSVAKLLGCTDIVQFLETPPNRAFVIDV